MTTDEAAQFRMLHNIPNGGAVATVRGGHDSRAVIRTAHGETFRASCTRGPYWALKAAMDKWRESEDRRLDEYRGFPEPVEAR